MLRHLHHHVVLVLGAIDGRDLTLAEGVIERVVDGPRRDPQLGGRVAVDLDETLQSVLLGVGIDVHQGRLALHLLGQAGGPGLQGPDVRRLQRVLVGGVGLAPAHAHVLDRVQEHAGAGDA